jgi:hypothetical protein
VGCREMTIYVMPKLQQLVGLVELVVLEAARSPV